MNRILRITVCFALLSSLAVAQSKKKPAPADLTRPPLDTVNVAELKEPFDKVDVFLLLGQSNMKGRGVMPAEPLRNPQIIMMHKVTDGWFLARHPLHLVGSPKDFSDADNAGVGPGLAFAETLAKALPTTRIALLPCAVGGSNITQWRKGRTLYDETVRRAKLALEHGPKGKTRIAGALWLQGESDTKTPEKLKAYPAALGQLIDNLRTDLGVTDLPFVACTIGEMKAEAEPRKQMNAILLDIKSIRPNTACIDSRTFAKDIGDNVHFNTPTQKEHGRRYAAEYLKLIGKD